MVKGFQSLNEAQSIWNVYASVMLNKFTAIFVYNIQSINLDSFINIRSICTLCSWVEQMWPLPYYKRLSSVFSLTACTSHLLCFHWLLNLLSVHATNCILINLMVLLLPHQLICFKQFRQTMPELSRYT